MGILNPKAYRDWHNSPWDVNDEKQKEPRKVFFREGYYTIEEIEVLVAKEREEDTK